MSAPKFKVGDRVRVAVSGKSSPKGRRGTIKSDGPGHWIHFDDHNPSAWKHEKPSLGIPAGYCDCIDEEHLEPITNDTMNDELKVTKAAVLEAAKCATVGDAIKAMFPEAFKKEDEPFEFVGTTWTTAKAYSEGPLMVADSSAPYDLKRRCLLVCPGWEMRQQEHHGRTILTFHRKP